MSLENPKSIEKINDFTKPSFKNPTLGHVIPYRNAKDQEGEAAADEGGDPAACHAAHRLAHEEQCRCRQNVRLISWKGDYKSYRTRGIVKNQIESFCSRFSISYDSMCSDCDLSHTCARRNPRLVANNFLFVFRSQTGRCVR